MVDEEKIFPKISCTIQVSIFAPQLEMGFSCPVHFQSKAKVQGICEKFSRLASYCIMNLFGLFLVLILG